MLFSVNTTFYKAEKYIESVYNGIKEQTYTNWEWIVTDDFSGDGSKEKLLEIAKNDKRVRYVEQEYKKQMFWNPQQFCNGDVVITMDSDDKLYPKAFEVYHRMFLKYPELVLITTDSNHHNEVGEFLNNKYLRYDHINSLFDRTLKLYKDREEKRHTFQSQGQCWGDLRAFKNMAGLDFNPGNKWKYHANDHVTVCLVEERGKVLSLPRTLYYYNVREDSICHASVQSDWVNELEDINNYISSRRTVKLNSILKVYEPVWIYTTAFLWSDLNLERTQKFISLNTLNELTHTEKELLQDLYFDHKLFFNEINKDIDYVFLEITNDKDFDIFSQKFLEIKEIIQPHQKFSVQITLDYWNTAETFPLLNKFLNSIQGLYGYHWASFLNNFATIRIF
jgi:glycosyltransferase involved in cell wall biosynthesis